METMEIMETMDIILETEIDNFSYGLGVNIAKNIQSQGIDEINADAFTAAINDVFGNADLKLSDHDANQIVQEFLSKAQTKKFESVKLEGEAFLAENAKRQEVTVTESGLQYEVIEMGQGNKPSAENTVKVHYHGTLINGNVFDSSVERGQPISFPLNGVIPGWTEGVQLMPVGSKFKFFIPFNLAYGERGAGADIAPFAALIFEVELLGIE